MKDHGPISIEHRSPVEDYLRRFPPVASEMTFTNLFAWRAGRSIRLVETDEALLAFWERADDCLLFGAPLGPARAEEIIAAAKACDEKPLIALERVPTDAAAAIAPQGWRAIEDRANADYVYRRDDLASLEGRRYHKKRNLIHQCVREYDPTYESISGDNLAEVRALMDRWCAARDCGRTPGLCHEYRAVQETLGHYEELGLFGGCIRIAGELAAFTVGERLNENTAVIHFEKAMGEFKGLSQLINQRFCQEGLADVAFVNREQDLGIEGLRQAKESYFPDHLIEKSRVVPEAGAPTHEGEPERCAEYDTE